MSLLRKLYEYRTLLEHISVINEQDKAFKEIVFLICGVLIMMYDM